MPHLQVMFVSCKNSTVGFTRPTVADGMYIVAFTAWHLLSPSAGRGHSSHSRRIGQRKYLRLWTPRARKPSRCPTLMSISRVRNRRRLHLSTKVPRRCSSLGACLRAMSIVVSTLAFPATVGSITYRTVLRGVAPTVLARTATIADSVTTKRKGAMVLLWSVKKGNSSGECQELLPAVHVVACVVRYIALLHNARSQHGNTTSRSNAGTFSASRVDLPGVAHSSHRKALSGRAVCRSQPSVFDAVAYSMNPTSSLDKSTKSYPSVACP